MWFPDGICGKSLVLIGYWDAAGIWRSQTCWQTFHKMWSPEGTVGGGEGAAEEPMPTAQKMKSSLLRKNPHSGDCSKSQRDVLWGKWTEEPRSQNCWLWSLRGWLC